MDASNPGEPVAIPVDSHVEGHGFEPGFGCSGNLVGGSCFRVAATRDVDERCGEYRELGAVGSA